jgi:hypothetical protein
MGTSVTFRERYRTPRARGEARFGENGGPLPPERPEEEPVPNARPRRALALAAALLALAPSARAESFHEAVDRWDGVVVEATSRGADGLVLRSGRMTLTLSKGRVARVLAGGEPVGLFVSGEGTLRHLSDDAVEHPVVRYVAKRNTDLDLAAAGGGLVLSEPFTEALWLASGTPLPEAVGTADAGSLREAFARHRARFADLAERPVGQQFARARRDGPAVPFVRVEIGGGKDDLVYVLDALDARSETLLVAHRLPYLAERGDGRKHLAAVSDQPVGRPRREAARPPFLLTAVDLVLTASDGERASLTATESFLPVGGTPSVLLLDLYDAILRPTHVGALEKKRVRLTGVFDEAGRPLEFDHRNDSVAVALPGPLQRGKPTTVRFEVEGDLLFRPRGDNYWQLGTEPWFPQPDMGGQYYTVRSTVKVRKPFRPLVPGTTVRRSEEGEYNVLESRIDKPVQFFVVLAGKYEWDEETKDGLTIRVASYAGENRRAYKKLLGLSRKTIDYFSGFLGAFPFEEFNIVEINSYGYGQAPPAFMFITTEAFNPIDGRVNQLFSEGINERVSHEIAHQWWGHVVKMPGGEEQWLSESFAEYCAALFIRDLRGKGDYEGLKAGWRRRANESRDVAPIPLANRVFARNDQAIAFSHRTALLYSKGPVLLEALHRELGDQRFLVFLASVQSNLAWKFGSTPMVQQVLDAVAKTDHGGFLADYYWGTGLPPPK